MIGSKTMYDQHRQMREDKADDSVTQVLDKLEKLDVRMAKIEKYLERQKGFIGGFLLITTVVAWALSQLKDLWR
jgi:hypothetical protein